MDIREFEFLVNNAKTEARRRDQNPTKVMGSKDYIAFDALSLACNDYDFLLELIDEAKRMGI